MLNENDRAELSNILFTALFAFVIALLFLLLTTLILWPLSKLAIALLFAKGYGVLLVLLIAVTLLDAVIRQVFRIDEDSHFDLYVLYGSIFSGTLQIGWSAFAAIAVHNVIAGVPIWGLIILFLLGFLSCYVAASFIAVFFSGKIYQILNLILAVISFVVFAIWPASAQWLFGWFFTFIGS